MQEVRPKATPIVSEAPKLKRELRLSDLTLFAICCITSARWIPIAAHAGPGSIVLWLFAAAFFVVPGNWAIKSGALTLSMFPSEEVD